MPGVGYKVKVNNGKKVTFIEVISDHTSGYDADIQCINRLYINEPLYRWSAVIWVETCWTWRSNLTLSMGATAVLETAAATPPATKSLAKFVKSNPAMIILSLWRVAHDGTEWSRVEGFGSMVQFDQIKRGWERVMVVRRWFSSTERRRGHNEPETASWWGMNLIFQCICMRKGGRSSSRRRSYGKPSEPLRADEWRNQRKRNRYEPAETTFGSLPSPMSSPRRGTVPEERVPTEHNSKQQRVHHLIPWRDIFLFFIRFILIQLI